MTEKDKLYADKLRNKALSDYERLNHAINELERQTCETPRNNLAESLQDCVSRETAIDQFIHWYSELLLSQKEEVSFKDILKSLPPVTPSYNSINTELKPCEDCISREEAKKLIQGKIDDIPKNKDGTYGSMFGQYVNGLYCAKTAISYMPSVTPSIPDVENNFNLGYNCGYADAMSDVSNEEG